MKNAELLALANRIAKDMTALADRLVPEMKKFADNADPNDAKQIKKALKETRLSHVFKELDQEKRDLENKLKKYK